MNFLFQKIEFPGVAGLGRGGIDAAAPLGPFGTKFGQKRLALFCDDVGERLEIFSAPIGIR